MTTASRNNSRSLPRLRLSRSAAHMGTSIASRMAAVTSPARRRFGVSPLLSLGSTRPLPMYSWLTTCTSIDPDSRVMVMPVPGPVRAATIGWRRLAPRTIWVALLARAKSSRAVGMSSPTTGW